ncbi:hypothetical protein CYLTODRAFT_460322 [Cylindrobasidium torrendii FP15055 ss-10]|uniref:Uncharacterized protein n=1 Tax=Cylindrobasidium torrendii FP15055 ss-10 TaxID=1314674 RepID=A0A0D7AUD0_9AGAR|nr:hypothetical protein CYLTODRAFT_460322 [Cylindrobasidium torrendii FP15055 ss-10]
MDEQRSDNLAQDLISIVKVAPHRRGCFVLQRCMDHASGHHRAQVVMEMMHHAPVQDTATVVRHVLNINAMVPALSKHVSRNTAPANCYKTFSTGRVSSNSRTTRVTITVQTALNYTDWV